MEVIHMTGVAFYYYLIFCGIMLLLLAFVPGKD